MKSIKNIFIFLTIVMVGAFLFYWVQFRSAKIKHDCSWVKKYAAAIPAKEGLSDEQLREKGLLTSCSNKLEDSETWNKDDWLCWINNGRIIEQYKPQRYVPARYWWAKATKEEYQFCLHDKGL